MPRKASSDTEDKAAAKPAKRAPAKKAARRAGETAVENSAHEAAEIVGPAVDAAGADAPAPKRKRAANGDAPAPAAGTRKTKRSAASGNAGTDEGGNAAAKDEGRDDAAKDEATPTPAEHRADTASVSSLVGPPVPDTAYDVVEKMLVRFVGDEVRKVGVERAVLGLSGGVDSAVSAAIAARALGPANVLGVMMPYQSSSPESLADAYEVAGSLGIETMVVEITGQVDAYFARFPDASRLRRGNKMARERMTVLYDQSAARSALVIGTSNKTELLLGYGTLYGDMASALNPIGDLYKTQVWGLARHLALPASVIEKAPTADLWSGQTDETELGFSYHQVDRLLYRLIDERCSPAELAAMGFDDAFVARISRMIRSSQFKRRLPIIAKLSARSIDTDFRYSRDWGL